MTKSQPLHDQLLACPFDCGFFCEPTVSGSLIGTAEELQAKADVWEYRVRCNCGAEGPVKYTEAEAITAWNTRAELTRNTAIVDKLAEAGQKVLDGLNARIDAAPANAVPLFDGIADLHEALATYRESVK